jgi:hypothetical protein
MSSQGQSGASGQPQLGRRGTTFNIYTNVTTHSDYQGDTKVEVMEEDKEDKKTEDSEV